MKFRITTLGCKVNQFESDAIAQALESQGWQRAAEEDQAEVCIVNTCTVTGKASMQSRQIIRQFMRREPGARIIVTGCYAQTAPDEIEKIGGVDYIIGHFDKSDIPRLIIASLSNPPRQTQRRVRNIHTAKQFSLPPAPAYSRRTRPFLKIQDGCNRFCTYCIVPHARGPSRSMPFETVMACLVDLGRGGYQEVVLTGIHLGAYGQDLDPPSDLIALLRRIEVQRPITRLRLSSIEPDEVNGTLVDLLASSEMICPHLHLPLQSGDDRVLERMHRPYSRMAFAQTVTRIKNAMPGCAIGADILVGFPGEDEAAFERTFELVADLPLAYLHVFPFSARPGTPAYHFCDQVPDAVIKARTAALRKLGQDKKRAFAQAGMASIHAVLVENKRDRRTGWLKGLTANYIPTLLEGDDRLMNRIVTVEPQRLLSDGRLKGIMLNKNT
ncbi:MAG: tRNA (N(6)-L-threonylcarbamoyladenosine(37)-C(2))-methylthiotransferase MtaB [Desulfobacterales bacterium]|nr:tRNA (N(6)-L-threonylcarbamoyladenosine(37)-C(2))-methylthiotransferase MtaB [Desulfobacterales bacterium]MDJ0854813.1 tRNA (N(6)-L-threonylcarbamoyladenosine(37)-C(2))-methylthiotransferase MtaB [Desulfobacterales bacterium]